MSHFSVSGRVDELTDGTVGSVDPSWGPQSIYIGNPGLTQKRKGRRNTCYDLLWFFRP
jgi:hypothetical protein